VIWPIVVVVIALLATDYAHKRLKIMHKEPELGPLKDKVDEQALLIVVNTQAIEALKQDFEEVKRISEETKKLLSQTNIGIAFRPRSFRGDKEQK
jgi:hypothetical protein